MQPTKWITAALALGLTIPAGMAAADTVDYDMTQAGASSPSGIRPGEVVSALSELVLDYNNGMSWNITLGGDPVRVLETNPIPQTGVTLGELITHNDSSYVIYDRLAVRAVLQWIGYDNGQLSIPDPPVRLGYWTEQGLFNGEGLPWVETGASSGGGGLQPPPESLLTIPEPSTLALTVIAGSAVLSMFRRKRYGSHD